MSPSTNELLGILSLARVWGAPTGDQHTQTFGVEAADVSQLWRQQSTPKSNPHRFSPARLGGDLLATLTL
jgi:hypothetical protein